MKEMPTMLKLRIVKNKDYLDILKHMLHDNNIIVYKDSNGKPFIKNSNYYFSVSHSANKMALIISNHPVGIDMEIIRKYDSKLLKYLNIKSNLSNKDFFKEWTKREAYIKKNNLKLSNISILDYSDSKFITFKLFKRIISICY